MDDQGQSRYSAQQFRDLVKDIPFAMFTTITTGGGLRSRPMVASENAFDGTLWFFTRTSSAVAQEVAANTMVNVTYVSAPEDRFVSVSGTASVVRDVERAGGMWSPAYNQWFAGGASDPELSLIKIEVARVEFWDRKAGRMREL
jgi:general stress protein 26